MKICWFFILAALTCAHLFGQSELGIDECLEDDDQDFQEDAFGPGYLNTVSGNGRLSAGFGNDGTLTVFRYPSPSHFDHVNFSSPFIQDACEYRNRPRNGGSKDQGAYWLLAYSNNGKRHVEALARRHFDIEQRYLSDNSNIVATTYIHKNFSLEVKILSFVPSDEDALIYRVKLANNEEELGDIKLAYYSNFSPNEVRHEYFPVYDTLLESFYQSTSFYDQKNGRLVHSSPNENYHISIKSRPAIQKAYIGESAMKKFWFFDNDEHPLKLFAENSPAKAKKKQGKLASLIVIKPEFENNQAKVKLVAAMSQEGRRGANDLGNMLEKDLLQETRKYWKEWTNRLKLPSESDEAVSAAKRALINIKTGTDAKTKSVVASLANQPPYAYDWPRDLAFIIYALDLSGQTELATETALHLSSLARDCQNSPDWVCRNQRILSWLFDWPLLDGTYEMNYFTDGAPGAPIFFEIDNTALSVWIMVEHAKFLNSKKRVAYLEQVWPTVKRAATTLMNCKDEETKLQCKAFEDDDPLPRQTIHGANTVLLALKSARDAAAELGRDMKLQEGLKLRVNELEKAIANHFLGDIPKEMNPKVFGAYAWTVWPGKYFKGDDPKLCELSGILYENLKRHLLKKSMGARYLGKITTALIHIGENKRKECLNQSDLVFEQALKIISEEMPDPLTRQYGEAFAIKTVNGEKRFINRTAVPHIWQGSLNYIAQMLWAKESD